MPVDGRRRGLRDNLWLSCDRFGRHLQRRLHSALLLLVIVPCAKIGVLRDDVMCSQKLTTGALCLTFTSNSLSNFIMFSIGG